MDDSTGSVAALAYSSSKGIFGALAVSKTLGNMSQNPSAYGLSDSSEDFAFEVRVLSAAYAGKGTMVDSMI